VVGPASVGPFFWVVLIRIGLLDLSGHKQKLWPGQFRAKLFRRSRNFLISAATTPRTPVPTTTATARAPTHTICLVVPLSREGVNNFCIKTGGLPEALSRFRPLRFKRERGHAMR